MIERSVTYRRAGRTGPPGHPVNAPSTQSIDGIGRSRSERRRSITALVGLFTDGLQRIFRQSDAHRVVVVSDPFEPESGFAIIAQILR
ncbi:hypothetical protein BDD21_1571 [Thiocapsa rosea]|uniref:Uncharacterized protein n=1 Tax=Thiocapsa rosea TaxID=69360 RepID=A0A495V4J5_9GAMM|nr:hypothetical protein BDD21_1571 [Thiocapsa rosea]